MNERYNTIIIMGKQCTGKTTLQNIISNLYHKYHKVITYTTRPIRDNEINHFNYHFVSPEEFAEKNLLEFTIFPNGWAYGTALEEFRKDKINILIANPSNIMDFIYDKNINVLMVCILKINLFTKIKRWFIRKNKTETLRRAYCDMIDFSSLMHILKKKKIPYIKRKNNNVSQMVKTIEKINKRTKIYNI